MEEEQQTPNIPMSYTARFWFTGLDRAVDFPIIEADFHRFQSYLAESDPKEFFEFDTPGHTVVLANMVHVDALKLISLPFDESTLVWEEEPSEAAVQLVGRFEPFSASTSEEHLGPDHPVRELLNVETEKFVKWLDARGQTVIMNPKRLSYVEHPKYWIENTDEWTEDDSEAAAEEEVVEEDTNDAPEDEASEEVKE